MDYETFGEHQWQDTGIFTFFEEFVSRWLENPDNTFYTVSEAIDANKPADTISMPQTVTWAGSERDLTAWLGNSMQHEAMRHLYALEDDILRSNDGQLIEDWRKLQASDHAYYMCTSGSPMVTCTLTLARIILHTTHSSTTSTLSGMSAGVFMKHIIRG